ncbi:hypothetical protein NKH71_25760 [Mesorhizobium sp. M0983]|uniref:hypothetical protein n=1 Tax=Mesorhizobium sp. M0983 TaxID=2957040 RepID=UPI00333B0C43
MDEHKQFVLFACQHSDPQQNQKTNPEQTLSVPVVFRNCLKFNECVRARETIPLTKPERCIFTAAGVIALILLSFAASGFPEGGTGIGRQPAKGTELKPYRLCGLVNAP